MLAQNSSELNGEKKGRILTFLFQLSEKYSKLDEWSLQHQWMSSKNVGRRLDWRYLFIDNDCRVRSTHLYTFQSNGTCMTNTVYVQWEEGLALKPPHLWLAAELMLLKGTEKENCIIKNTVNKKSRNTTNFTCWTYYRKYLIHWEG